MKLTLHSRSTYEKKLIKLQSNELYDCYATLFRSKCQKSNDELLILSKFQRTRQSCFDCAFQNRIRHTNLLSRTHGSIIRIVSHTPPPFVPVFCPCQFDQLSFMCCGTRSEDSFNLTLCLSCVDGLWDELSRHCHRQGAATDVARDLGFGNCEITSAQPDSDSDVEH